MTFFFWHKRKEINMRKIVLRKNRKWESEYEKDNVRDEGNDKRNTTIADGQTKYKEAAGQDINLYTLPALCTTVPSFPQSQSMYRHPPPLRAGCRIVYQDVPNLQSSAPGIIDASAERNRPFV